MSVYKIKEFQFKFTFLTKMSLSRKRNVLGIFFRIIKEHFFHLSTGNWLKVKITKLTYIDEIQASSDLLVISNITHILLKLVGKNTHLQ